MCLLPGGRRALCTSLLRGEEHYVPPSGGTKGIMYLLVEGRRALCASFRREEGHYVPPC